jgi:uncharacterized protein (UPF0210 family)
VDLVGGFSALDQKGWTEAERRLIAALPEVLSTKVLATAPSSAASFGETAILPVHAAGGSTPFVRHGGRIPTPLSSLRN